MLKIIDKNKKSFKQDFLKIFKNRESTGKNIDSISREIIENVKKKSDDAIVDYTIKFDNFKIKKFDNLVVSTKEIEQAFKITDRKVLKALRHAMSRIRNYHKRQLPKNELYTDNEGVSLGVQWHPVSSVGCYVPGGKASYPSSVLMNVIPAQVAGVKRIVMVVPTPSGFVNPTILAAAKLLKIKEIYKIGGAQAVAALAYGTKFIKKVDKICGPGNAYVASAKKQVFGTVGIDMIAGPSEILVVADKYNNPKHIAIDLLSQAEHDELAQSILITDDINFANSVNKCLNEELKKLERRRIAEASCKNFGAIILVQNIRDSIQLINEISPEHLELSFKNCERFLKKINNAGAIFIGKYTPEAIGDYIAGPNHVLPTNKTSRFSSGLNVLDFMKRTSLVKCSFNSLKKIGPDAINLAEEEGLGAHALSIRTRIENKE